MELRHSTWADELLGVFCGCEQGQVDAGVGVPTSNSTRLDRKL